MLLYEEQLKKCVAFVMTEVEDKERLGARVRRALGTAFLVNVRIPGTAFYVTYAVTARHNVVLARASGNLYLKINLEGGDATEIPLPPDDWTIHPTTDVAAISLDAHPPHASRRVDALGLPDELLLQDGHKFKNLFAAGDDVIIVALFVLYPGSKQNEPILRFGKVSLLPKEPLRVEIEPETFQSVTAVLVEAVSWGGQSGAPVFVDRSQYGGPGPFLLGLIHGHQQLRQEIEIQGEERGEVQMNAGIVIVIPAQAIFETLMDDHFVWQREKLGEWFAQMPKQSSTEN